MVELNEKGLAAACRSVSGITVEDNAGYPAQLSEVLRTAIRVYLSALPAPDDGLEVVAWTGQGVIPISAAEMDALIDSRDGDAYLYTDALVNLSDAQAALQSKDEQIEKLTRKEAESFQQFVDANEARLDAEQQVQKLTAENERLREAQDSKIAEFRDKVALGASPDEILRFRDGYPNPAGGSKVFYRHTIEQARYRYADAILAARSALETQEGGK